ncbi:MAG: hypothetical protein LUG50_05780 [Planctomycetaceae bacterium]|nr:hypothetical protein [Planctomycetaceae bacterium]
MRTLCLSAALVGLVVLIGCGNRAPDYSDQQVATSAPRPNLYPLTAPPPGSAQPLPGYAPTRISAVSNTYDPLPPAGTDPYAAQAAVRTGVGPYTGGTYTTNAFAGYEPAAPGVTGGYATAPAVYTPPSSGPATATAGYAPAPTGGYGPTSGASYGDPFAGVQSGGFMTPSGGYCTVEEMRAGMDPGVPITDPPVLVNGRPANLPPQNYRPATGSRPSMSLSANTLVPPGGTAQGNLIYGPVEGTADIVRPVPGQVGFGPPPSLPTTSTTVSGGFQPYQPYPPMQPVPAPAGSMSQPGFTSQPGATGQSGFPAQSGSMGQSGPMNQSRPLNQPGGYQSAPVVTGPAPLASAQTQSSFGSAPAAPLSGPSRYGAAAGGGTYPALLSSAVTIPAASQAGSGTMPTPALVTTTQSPQASEYRLVPALDVPPQYHEGDYAPSQWFEVVGPGNTPVQIGRISSTCTCVGVRIPKRHYQAGERILIEARTVAKPARNNLVYGIYVNILEPVRTVVDADVTVSI